MNNIINKEINKIITGFDEKTYRYSGFSHFSPSERSQVIFSHVVIISPKEASTIVFPVSREETLVKTKKRMSYVCMYSCKADKTSNRRNYNDSEFLLAYKLLVFDDILEKYPKKLTPLLEAALFPSLLSLPRLCYAILDLRRRKKNHPNSRHNSTTVN